MAKQDKKPPHRSAPKRIAHTIRRSNHYLKLGLMGVFLFVLGAVSAYRFLQRVPVNNLQNDLQSNQIVNPIIQPSLSPQGDLFNTPQPSPALFNSDNSQGEITPTAATQSVYVVKKGDSLWKIAQQLYGDPYQWVNVYNQNKVVIGKNPGVIYAGMQLVLPTSSSQVGSSSSSSSTTSFGTNP